MAGPPPMPLYGLGPIADAADRTACATPVSGAARSLLIGIRPIRAGGHDLISRTAGRLSNMPNALHPAAKGVRPHPLRARRATGQLASEQTWQGNAGGPYRCGTSLPTGQLARPPVFGAFRNPPPLLPG